MHHNVKDLLVLAAIMFLVLGGSFQAGASEQAEKQIEKPSLLEQFIAPICPDNVTASQANKPNEMTEKMGQNMEELEGKVSSYLDGKVASFLGPWVKTKAIMGITWFTLLLCVLLLIFVFVGERGLRGLIRAVKRRMASKEDAMVQWTEIVVEALTRPLSLSVWVFGVYGALLPVIMSISRKHGSNPVHEVAVRVVYTGAIIAFSWFVYRLMTLADARLTKLAGTTGTTFDKIIAALAKYWRAPLKLLLILLMIRAIFPFLTGPPALFVILGYAFILAFIVCIAWWIIATANITEDFVHHHYKIGVKNDLHARKIRTQTVYFKRVITILVVILAFGSMLMVFPTVRTFGTSILASAGVLGIIAGLAVQRTLANIFVGIQIAITQPIRVEDAVIVENEWGWIEEITATYVVVRIWDLRRLILPISYFAEKPFQNWTRISTDLIGSVFMYVDYSVHVDDLRQQLQHILEQSDYWDGKSWALQVTDTQQTSMQLRATMSAANSSATWNLRCEVREKMIEFIQQNYPESFPRVRAELIPNTSA